MEPFFAKFREVVQAPGKRSDWSPFKFVDAWRTFVKSVADGYDGDLYDYQNELSLRDRLECAVAEVSLTAWPEWKNLLNQISEADQRFGEAITDGPVVRHNSSWWNERLPRFASAQLSEDALERYGVVVKTL